MLEFVANYGYQTCASCRELYDAEGRYTPCDEKGFCQYTGTEEEPITEQLDRFSELAWEIWNDKELLGWEIVRDMKVIKLSEYEADVVFELLKFIEVKAIEYRIKQPKGFCPFMMKEK